MANLEIFLYLAIIILYFLFNYIVNNVLGKKQQEDGAPPAEQKNEDWEPFDPYNPFPEEEVKPEEQKYRDQTTQTYEEARERGRLASDQNVGEQRTDLGKRSTIFKEERTPYVDEGSKSNYEDETTRARDEKKAIQKRIEELEKRTATTDSLAAPTPKRIRSSSGIGRSMSVRAHKKRLRGKKKFRFDPVKAIIYSEILKRPY